MYSRKSEKFSLLPAGAEEETLNLVIKSLRIKNNTMEITSATNPGDNFMGTVLRIRVVFHSLPKDPSFSYQKNDDGTYVMSLILKASIRNPEIRAFIPQDMYVRENHIYTNVLKTYEELQIKKGINLKTEGFTQYPNFFVSCLNNLDEFLILADKCLNGFVTRRRQDLLDFSHCLIVIKQLAKYHALSFVLQKENPQLFDRLKTPLVTHSWAAVVNADEFLETFKVILTKAKNSLDPEEDKKVVDAYKPAEEVTYLMMVKMMRSCEWEKYLVFSHGDCWINNILFKYKNATQQEIDDICFIDFALPSLISPIIDLSNFLYANAQVDVIKHQANDLIENYYKSLSNFINYLGHDPEELFPKAEFHKRLPQYFTISIYWSTLMSNIIFQEAEEAHAANELKSQMSFRNQWNKFSGFQWNVAANKKIAAVMTHAYESGFFDVEKYSKEILGRE